MVPLDRLAGRGLTPSGGPLPRRPAAVRPDDITDQPERNWARRHDGGWGYPYLKLSRSPHSPRGLPALCLRQTTKRR